jgi:hypothetical protein
MQEERFNRRRVVRLSYHKQDSQGALDQVGVIVRKLPQCTFTE